MEHFVDGDTIMMISYGFILVRLFHLMKKTYISWVVKNKGEIVHGFYKNVENSYIFSVQFL